VNGPESGDHFAPTSWTSCYRDDADSVFVKPPKTLVSFGMKLTFVGDGVVDVSENSVNFGVIKGGKWFHHLSIGPGRAAAFKMQF